MKKFIVFAVAFSTLTLGFYSNPLQVADTGWFENFGDDAEAFLICRLAKSRQDGIFSEGGLAGREVQLPAGKHKFKYQHEIYYNNIPLQQYKLYKSTPAFQGILFSILDRCLGQNARTNIKLFRLITASISACILSIFLLWVLDIFGLLSALMTLVFIMLSPWLTATGGHIHWIFGMLLLPFMVPLVLLHREHKGKKLSSRVWFTSIALATLLKCLFTGYELITTALVMLTIPLFFYALWQRWKPRLFIRRFLAACLAGILGVTISAVILSLQIAQAEGSMQKGLLYLQHRLVVRTYPNEAYIDHEIPQAIKDTNNVPIATVLETYLGGTALSITTRYGGAGLTFGNLLSIFAAVSALIFVRKKNSALIALTITTWISILAPLSWFIIFKSHSVRHPHLDPLSWYIPMFLLLFTSLASLNKSVR